ncbi:hypothetical protein ABPG75_002691 [Micractinium tetrahymenae]
MRGNKSLRVLQLGSNPLGETGAPALVDALKARPMAVEVLELRRCGIGSIATLGQAAPPALLDLLSTTPSLIVLDLRDNNFDDEGLQQLRKWGLHNRLAELEGSDRLDRDLCMLLLD